MLECLSFLLNLVVKFISMLFTIDIGHNMTLGGLMCVVFIFLPMVLLIVRFLKVVVVDEVDERYDRGESIFGRYVGKHEYVGRHSKKYLDRK